MAKYGFVLPGQTYSTNNRWFSTQLGNKGFLTLDIDDSRLKLMIDQAGRSFAKITNSNKVSKEMALKLIELSRPLTPFKNEYKLRKRKKGVKGDYYKQHYYMGKKEKIFNPIYSEQPKPVKSSRKVTSSNTIKKMKQVGTRSVITQETKTRLNKNGSLKHKTNGMLDTFKTYRQQILPVYDKNTIVSETTNTKTRTLTETINKGSGRVVEGYETSYTTGRKPWKKVSHSSTRKNSLYAQGKAWTYNREGVVAASDTEWAKTLMSLSGKYKYEAQTPPDANKQNTNALYPVADRPPHLRDKYKVKYSDNTAQIVYNVRKPKSDKYTEGGEGGEYYAEKQYFAQDIDWDRFTEETTSRWLEVAVGAPVPAGTKLKSVPDSERNYQKLVRVVQKEIDKQLRK